MRLALIAGLIVAHPTCSLPCKITLQWTKLRLQFRIDVLLSAQIDVQCSMPRGDPKLPLKTQSSHTLLALVLQTSMIFVRLTQN